MAKKRQAGKTKSESFASFFKISFYFLCLISVILLALMFLNDEKNTKEQKTSIKKEQKIAIKNDKTIVNAINSYKKDKDLDKNFNEIFNEIYTKDKSNSINNLTTEEKSAFGNEKTIQNNKAKLAIIIDDVATKDEKDEIKELIKNGKIITPSFFPNTSNHPDTNIYANEFSHFMVHLPLEALKFTSPEPKTLKITDSYQQIEQRIKEIKTAFPRLKYLNNHTGSAFTSDEKAMKKLFKALKKHKIIFIDSRTIISTKAPKLAKEFDQFYIHRNIFLDNDQKLDAIKIKLDEACKLAIKQGYAIAIAHPHKNSLKAIKEYDFSKVELVYIDDIYNYYR